MQTLAQKIRQTQQKCKKCKEDKDLQQDAQQCRKKVCQQAKQTCKTQGQQKACAKETQCQKHKKGQQIKVAVPQEDYACKRDVQAHNKCVKQKQKCDITKVVAQYTQQKKKTSSGGIGLW
jgi:hypothetical protein